MTTSAVGYTNLPSSREAGAFLGSQLMASLGGDAPDAVILFASPQYEFDALLAALADRCRPRVLVGASSAGEFTSQTRGEGSACAVALRAPDMRFSASVGRGLRADRAAVADAVVAGFQGLRTYDYPYRTALVFTDALAGYGNDLVERLTALTAGSYRFAGGGAGDDGEFRRTHVFVGTEALTDAAVALEILSHKPVGIGVSHGWRVASSGFRVTEAFGPHLVSLNATPAVEVFGAHAAATRQTFDASRPLPFFLHNVLGVETAQRYKLRVPLSVEPAGAVLTAAEVPEGALAHIMQTSTASAAEAASAATRAALQQLRGLRPRAALFFDCVATRLRMGKDFGFELQALREALGPASYIGFNSYGQIARAEGQFSGFHNCTAVACVIPE